VRDPTVPGLAVRVTDKGQKTFVLVARFPGSENPTRRALGEYAPLMGAELKAAKQRYQALPAEDREKLSFDEYLLRTYGAVTLASAREKARIWRQQIKSGVDPVTAETRLREAAQAAASNTFEAMAEKFISRQLPTQRRGHVVERILRKEIMPHWKARPIGDLTHRDVREVIDMVIERGARTYAHNVFDAARAVFGFAVDRGIIELSPCALLKPSKIIGAKAIRIRVLSDDELRAVWAAAGEVGYPFGPLVRTLMLTGCRLNEVACACWREFELEKRVWTIPAERFKSNAQHVVPLADDMMILLEGLPQFQRGDHVFSTTFGEKPVSGFSKAKARIDERVGNIPPWTFHDCRRSVRSRLSELRIPEHVAELAIGHALNGLARIYDQHRYQEEVREALTLWAVRLRSIVEPPPSNVINIQQKAIAP
jgi:integrase